MQKAWEQLPWWPAPTVGRIPGDFGHERAWDLGEKKEYNEGIRFYRSPMAEMHHGGRNRIGKEAAVFCSWLVLLVAVLHVLVGMQEG
jgi:hypothetical protein